MSVISVYGEKGDAAHESSFDELPDGDLHSALWMYLVDHAVLPLDRVYQIRGDLEELLSYQPSLRPVTSSKY